MKVLVTGATGYIGSHVCKLLKERGHYVEGWDTNIHGEHNNVTPYVDVLDNLDITDRYAVHGSYDAVVHLAGRSVVPLSLREPSEYYRVNTFGTENMVSKINTDNFIFASTSSAIYMKSPYARSKVAAEDIIKEKSLGYTIFRFFNVSGTNGIHRQLGDPTHLIRVAAMAAANKLSSINIFGNDYPTLDGTCIRDYIHVIDVSNSIVKAVENGPLNTPYECLGGNRGYSVLEVIDTMSAVTGKHIKTKISNRRQGDGDIQIANNISKYCNITKTLEDMCKDQYKLELK